MGGYFYMMEFNIRCCLFFLNDTTHTTKPVESDETLTLRWQGVWLCGVWVDEQRATTPLVELTL
jgi:hypothetical protein